MRKPAWIGAILVPSGVMFSLANSAPMAAIVPALIHLWWVFPLCAFGASNVVLVSSLAFSRGPARRSSTNLLTGSYLACGPSLALLGLAPSLGLSAPDWVGIVASSLLPMSAWAYYQSLEPQDDERMTS